MRSALRASMSRRGWLLFGAMCLLWGIPYLLIKVAVRDVSPAVLVLGRTGIASALLLPIAALRGEIRPALARWRPLLAFAGIEIALPWILLGTAEQRISSSLTGLLISAVPLVGAFIARTTGARERLGAQSAVGLALGVAGVAAIVGLDLGSTSGVALAAVAVVVVCYAVGPVILQRYLAGLPALGVTAASLAVAAIVYVPIAAASLPSSAPSAAAAGSVVALAVVCTGVAFLVFFELIAEIGPMRATVITYVNPAVAAALGVTILGERLTLGMVAGFVLVLAGSVLATRPPASQRPAAVPAPERAAVGDY